METPTSRTPYPIAVLTAAAKTPYKGISRRFSTMFVAAALAVTTQTHRVRPVMIVTIFIGMR
jgi:hypothetical protein